MRVDWWMGRQIGVKAVLRIADTSQWKLRAFILLCINYYCDRRARKGGSNLCDIYGYLKIFSLFPCIGFLSNSYYTIIDRLSDSIQQLEVRFYQSSAREVPYRTILSSNCVSQAYYMVHPSIAAVLPSNHTSTLCRSHHQKSRLRARVHSYPRILNRAQK